MPRAAGNLRLSQYAAMLAALMSGEQPEAVLVNVSGLSLEAVQNWCRVNRDAGAMYVARRDRPEPSWDGTRRPGRRQNVWALCQPEQTTNPEEPSKKVREKKLLPTGVRIMAPTLRLKLPYRATYKGRHLGYFADPEQAHAAVKKARSQLGIQGAARD